MNLSLANLGSPLGSHTLRVAVAVVCALAAVASYIFAFYYIDSESAKASLAEDNAIADQLKGQKLQALARVIAISNGDVDRLNAYLVTPDTVVDLIEHIESLATHAGVTVDISQASVGSSLSFSFATTGSYSNTRYFLTLLENLPLNTKFSNVTLVSDLPDGAKAPVWHGSYTIQILSFVKNG